MRVHFLLATLINLLIVGVLIYKVWEGNDKATLLILLFYPLLTLTNLAAWIVLRALRRKAAHVYKTTNLLLLLLFIPALLLSSLY